MSDYMVTDTELTAVADAIRTKGGTQEPIEWYSGFVDAIDDISAGGNVEPDGTYPDMTVGGLMGDGPTDQVPYLFRPSGGDLQSKVGNREIDKIVGGSLVWNQLVQNGDFSNGTTNWTNRLNETGSIAVSNGVLNFTISSISPAYLEIGNNYNIISGHKYIVCIDNVVLPHITKRMYFSLSNSALTNGSYIDNFSGGKYAKIISTTENASKTLIRVYIDTNGYEVNDVVLFDNVMCIDLTVMFGSTIADYIYSLEQATAGAGVAWFRNLFPENYYVYDAGTIQSVKTSAHIMRDADNNVIGNYALDNTLELRGIPKLDSNNQLYFDGDTYESDGTVTRNTILRAYQSGDESLANAITDGTNTVVYSANASTEQADPYTNPQIVDAYGTEEYTDYAYEAGDRDVAIPVGHVTLYPANLRKKIEGLPWDLSMIAPIENGTKASKAYSAGEYFLKDNQFCKALTSIASGATFTLNTNYTITTVAAEIYAAINA